MSASRPGDVDVAAGDGGTAAFATVINTKREIRAACVNRGGAAHPAALSLLFLLAFARVARKHGCRSLQMIRTSRRFAQLAGGFTHLQYYI